MAVSAITEILHRGHQGFFLPGGCFRRGPRRPGCAVAAPKSGAPLTAAGRCKPAPLGRKKQEKNLSHSFFVFGASLAVLCLLPVFCRKISRQDRLGKTI